MADDYRPKSPDLNFDEDEPQQLQQQQQQQEQHEENIPSHPLRIEAPAQHQPYNNWYQAQPQPYSPHGRSYSYSASAQSPIGLPTFHRPYQHQDPQSATSPTAGYTSPAFAPPTFYSHSHSQSHSFEPTQPFSPIGYPQHEQQQQQQQQPGYPTAYQPYFSQQHSQPKLPPHSYGAQPPRFDEGPTIYVKHEPEPDPASAAAKMPPRRAPAPEPPAVDPSPVKTKFPTARIKRIMQNDEEVGKVAQQTPIAVGKALEMFMIQLVTKSAEVARDKNSKRVTPAMLKTVIEADDQWDFLRDIASKVEPDREGGGGGAGSKGKAAVKPETDSDEELEEEEEEEVKPVRRRGGRKKKAPA